jgi:hypothetical protein
LAIAFFAVQAKAADPVDLSQGLEVRLPWRTSEVSGSWSGEWPLNDLGTTPGDLENLRITFRLGGFQVRPAGLGLNQMRIELTASRWVYKKPPILEVECRNIHAWFEPPAGLDVPWQPGLAVEWTRPEGAASTAVLSGPFEQSLDQTLKPLFSPTSLKTSLRLTAQCPGDTAKVLEATLRAWLANWPSKEPARWNEFMAKASDWAREGGGKALGPVLDKLPSKGSWAARLTLLRSDAGAWFLRGGDASRDPLSGAVRKTLAPLPARPELVLTGEFLDRAGRAALGLALGEKLDLPPVMRAEDLVPVFSEAVDLPPETQLRFRLQPLGCADDVESLRLRPWLGSTGIDRGLDLHFSPVFELIDVATGAEIARRRFPLELRFGIPRVNSPAGSPAVTFQGGRWRPEAPEDEVCGVASVAPEVGATADWVLRSDMLADYARQKLAVPALRGFDGVWSNLRVLGQATMANRRISGGYYGEALLIGFPL